MRLHSNSNSNGISFSIVLFTALVVLVLSVVLINFDNIFGASDSDEYVSYVVEDQISVYDLASSICRHDDNIWEIVYELKAANNLSSDTIQANSTVKIPTSVVDIGIDSISLCNADN